MGGCLSKGGDNPPDAKPSKGVHQNGAAGVPPGKPPGLSRVSVTSAEVPADKRSTAGASGNNLAQAEATVAAAADFPGATSDKAVPAAGAPAAEQRSAAAEPASVAQPADAATQGQGGDQAGEATAPGAPVMDPVQKESQGVALAGKPYISNKYGPPRPAFQEERLETVKAIKAQLAGQPPDPNITNMLNLAVSVFNIESAVVTLVEDDSFAVHNAAGKLGKYVGAELPWLTGICGFSLTPAHHEVLIVEDMAADARFNAEVRGGFDRFYCGAPLVAANGHRLGTMCLGDSSPKSLDANQINVLCNMAEMVVRHVEQQWAAHARRQSLEIGLKRTVQAYQKPFLFVEVGAADSGNWDIVYANTRASEHLGVDVVAGDKKPFWDAVQPAMGSLAPWKPFVSAVERGVRFSVTATLKSAPAGEADKLWQLQFRPAAKDALDAETQLLGVPAHVPRGPSADGNRFYIVELAETSPHGSAPVSDISSHTSLMPAVVPAAFDGLELGPLLGKGSFGRVYRGSYHGELVAVKIMDTSRVEFNDKEEPVEAVLTGAKHHPNLVGTIGWTVTKPPLPYPEDAAGEEAPSVEEMPDYESQTWLLLEFCDKPCLQDAVDRGVFREGEARQSSPPNMGAICDTASEVASGMAYLHSQNVVHGDLKGGNVLLKSNDNARGFTAKVADFGMARDLGIESRTKSNKYGTITHCPPELILEGTVSKGVDVWAFGVMLWEMYHGARAWAGLTHPQIMHAIGIAGTRLQFDRSDALPAHDTYFDLAEACMARDAAQRPAFGAMVLVLKTSAEAWNKLKQAGMATPKDLTDTECTSCVS